MIFLDFYNGWERGVLERAVDECNCNIYGDVSLVSLRHVTRAHKINYLHSRLAALKKVFSNCKTVESAKSLLLSTRKVFIHYFLLQKIFSILTTS